MIARLVRALPLLALLLLALAIGSLGLLAETARLLSARLQAGWELWARYRAIRMAGAYQYGGVKLAHAGAILLAAAGSAVGLLLAWLSLERMAAGTVPDRLGLAVAAVALAAICIWPVAVAGGRLRIGFSQAASVLALAGLTVAALTPDRATASTIDAALGLLLGCLLAARALAAGAAAVRDLIDHPLPALQERQLLRLLQEHGIAPGELAAMRSRRAGAELVLEVTLDPRDELVEDACRRLARARAALERSHPGLRIAMHWLPAD